MSLMSASYPGYYNNNNQSVPWRGVPAPGRAVSRPVSVGGGRDTATIPSPQGRLSNPPPFVDSSSAFAPSADPQAFRYENVAMGTNKRDDGVNMLRGDDYGADLRKTNHSDNEENYSSSNAMAIPGSSPDVTWKKGSSGSNDDGNDNGEASPPAGESPKRSSLDIEKEINGQNLYKTELCRSFVETGMCRYGSKCQFAHGQSELRPVLRHPKYKTDFCKTFHTIGTCPYGTRCRFIHKRSEVEIGQNSIFLPPNAANPPDWSVWKEGNAPDGKAFLHEPADKKSRSATVKERRKTAADVQQLHRLDKAGKVQRSIGRQRSNTDSPPPPLRRGKNPNSKVLFFSVPLNVKKINIDRIIFFNPIFRKDQIRCRMLRKPNTRVPPLSLGNMKTRTRKDTAAGRALEILRRRVGPRRLVLPLPRVLRLPLAGTTAPQHSTNSNSINNSAMLILFNISRHRCRRLRPTTCTSTDNIASTVASSEGFLRIAASDSDPVTSPPLPQGRTMAFPRTKSWSSWQSHPRRPSCPRRFCRMLCCPTRLQRPRSKLPWRKKRPEGEAAPPLPACRSSRNCVLLAKKSER